jgi:protein-disulfide isomerase
MHRTRGTWAVVGILALAVATPAVAQPGDDLAALGREIEALKAGQTAIRKELQEIKDLLRASPGAQAAPERRPQAPPIEPADVVVSVEGVPFKGDRGAKVTVVEFTDYQCPFCSRHLRQTWPQLEQDYVKTGKARFYLRDLPLESIHPQAFKAAEAAHCAGEQGKFWEMHARLFANQRALGRPDLSGHAQAIGLEAAAFDRCLDSGKGAARIRKDIADSEKAGARGTPIFYIGLTDPKSQSIRAVAIIRGARPYAVFKEAIDNLLASAR